MWRRYLPPSPDEPATAATPATSQSFQWDDVAAEEFEAATAGPEPQHDPGPDVAAVAGQNEACCGSVDARNADEMGLVASVAPVAPSAGNGGEPWDEPLSANGSDKLGLSQHTIEDLARRYTDRADAMRGGETLDQAELEGWLRQLLAGMVLPEFINVEFERVMDALFRV